MHRSAHNRLLHLLVNRMYSLLRSLGSSTQIKIKNFIIIFQLFDHIVNNYNQRIVKNMVLCEFNEKLKKKKQCIRHISSMQQF